MLIFIKIPWLSQIFIFHILSAIVLKIAIYFLFVFNIETCLKNFQRLFELAAKLFRHERLNYIFFSFDALASIDFILVRNMGLYVAGFWRY